MFKTLIDCESKSYGLELLIHETAHMEDLGALNGNRLDEINVKEFPPPQKLMKRFIKQNYPFFFLKENNGAVISLYDAYLNDSSMLSTTSFSKGLTEINANAHGPRTEYKVTKENFQLYGFLGHTLFC